MKNIMKNIRVYEDYEDYENILRDFSRFGLNDAQAWIISWYADYESVGWGIKQDSLFVVGGENWENIRDLFIDEIKEKWGDLNVDTDMISDWLGRGKINNWDNLLACIIGYDEEEDQIGSLDDSGVENYEIKIWRAEAKDVGKKFIFSIDNSYNKNNLHFLNKYLTDARISIGEKPFVRLDSKWFE